jgi:hypothetical protein
MANHLKGPFAGLFAALGRLERFLLKRLAGQIGKLTPMPIRDTLRPLAGLALLAVLTGCEAIALTPAIAVYGAVEGVALNQTGKLASDHAASAITGQDCSFLRYKDTGNYCRSAAEIAAQEAIERRDLSAYCYRRRGGVACYDTPDPTATDEIRVN